MKNKVIVIIEDNPVHLRKLISILNKKYTCYPDPDVDDKVGDNKKAKKINQHKLFIDLVKKYLQKGDDATEALLIKKIKEQGEIALFIVDHTLLPDSNVLKTGTVFRNLFLKNNFKKVRAIILSKWSRETIEKHTQIDTKNDLHIQKKIEETSQEFLIELQKQEIYNAVSDVTSQGFAQYFSFIKEWKKSAKIKFE